MNIKNYTWITGKVVFRLWGIEYRYTVENSDGEHINDIVMLLDGEKTLEEDVAKLIESLSENSKFLTGSMIEFDGGISKLLHDPGVNK